MSISSLDAQASAGSQSGAEKQPTQGERVIPEPLTIIGASAAMQAAARTGLIDYLREGPRSALQCAQALGTNPRATECVLEVLAAARLLTKLDGRFGLPKEASLAAIANGKALGQVASHFEHTTHLLQTGEPLPFMDESMKQREASYSSMVVPMGKIFADAAAQLASRLPIKPLRILDIGCGSGIWSLTIAKANPQVTVTGLDFPRVLEAFSAFARELNIERQIEMLPGDMYSVDFPKSHFDLVVIANVLRLEAPERARLLLSRSAEAVSPMGAILVVDALAGGTPALELQRAVYALHLAVRTGMGGIHTPDTLKGWLRDAGFPALLDLNLGVTVAALGAILGRRT